MLGKNYLSLLSIVYTYVTEERLRVLFWKFRTLVTAESGLLKAGFTKTAIYYPN